MAIKDGDKNPQVNGSAILPTQSFPPDGGLIGGSISDKFAFHGVTPTGQRTGTAQAAVVTTTATNTTPFGFSTAAQANALVTLVNELRAAMVEKGLIKGS